ncbi:unnamed protein product [Vitrella brassicaformis CCMP3155]|uniref:Uncharacterized protein n=1 Tax=Vitrella brassicaformis (strain CCMP3155) TaxID=1169540 RepID=A0A0G4EJ22_VITBC|nr:unnamed protein product [Vitrella brassicaformis CCMP3155]|eukprot:CEL95994.1 unnamed protein product [Vitrella brassicaformis CCMP3155]
MGNSHTADRSGATINDESLDFLHKADRDALHTRFEVGSLRATAHFLWEVDFSPYVLRTRLNRCLVAKGLQAIIAFDAQLESPLLLKAIWLVDTQQWTEVVNALKLAAQLGFCTLPVTISLQDIQRHTTKQAYLAEPRVLALWKMIGRHVVFGGNYGRFELFDQQGGVRALRDEPGYELSINPPLPATHPFHPHTINDNPPVSSLIHLKGGSWTSLPDLATFASASAFIMRIIIAMALPVENWGKTPWVHGNRHAHGGVLDGPLNHSPHQPPDGCTAVVAFRMDDMNPPLEGRLLLLTSFDMPFVAWVVLVSRADTNIVGVCVSTTEPPVSGASDTFKDRRPTAAPLVRGLLSNTIADMMICQKEKTKAVKPAGGRGELS